MTISDSGRLITNVTDAMRHVSETIILPRFNQLAEGEVRSKSNPRDLVTIADEEGEQALTPILRDLLPGSLVIGEEAAAADPKVLEHLLSEDYVWIIDPIDGTSNFVHGRAVFAVMIALVRKGETILGWIHEPIENRTLVGEKGAGTHRFSDGKSVIMRVVPPQSQDLSGMVAALYNPACAPLKTSFARLSRLGSAAHDYWALVENRLHVMCYAWLKPWDHAAGVLIHREAGGYNCLTSSVPYNAARANQTGLLAAPTREIWDAIRAQMSLTN